MSAVALDSIAGVQRFFVPPSTESKRSKYFQANAGRDRLFFMFSLILPFSDRLIVMTMNTYA
jgi:hypothetical protein